MIGSARAYDRGGAQFHAIETPDLVSRVAADITMAVREGRLRAGERLNEVHIAQQMDISRGPVREALRKLESQGLVVSRPRRGFFVRGYTQAELIEIYELRLCLELRSAEVALERMNVAALANLQARFAEMRELARKDDRVAQVEADFAFHLAIAEIAGNGRIHSLMESLSTELLAGIALVARIARDPVHNADTHLPILRAFEERDLSALRLAVTEHLHSGRDVVIQMFRENHPDGGAGHD